MCRDFEKTGRCPRRGDCTYAHGVSELHAHRNANKVRERDGAAVACPDHESAVAEQVDIERFAKDNQLRGLPVDLQRVVTRSPVSGVDKSTMLSMRVRQLQSKDWYCERCGCLNVVGTWACTMKRCLTERSGTETLARPTASLASLLEGVLAMGTDHAASAGLLKYLVRQYQHETTGLSEAWTRDFGERYVELMDKDASVLMPFILREGLSWLPAEVEQPALADVERPGSTDQTSEWYCERCGCVNGPTVELCTMRRCRTPRAGTETLVNPETSVAALLERILSVGVRTRASGGVLKYLVRIFQRESPVRPEAWSEYFGERFLELFDKDSASLVPFILQEGPAWLASVAPNSVIKPVPVEKVPVEKEKGGWYCDVCGCVNADFTRNCTMRACKAPRVGTEMHVGSETPASLLKGVLRSGRKGTASAGLLKSIVRHYQRGTNNHAAWTEFYGDRFVELLDKDASSIMPFLLKEGPTWLAQADGQAAPVPKVAATTKVAFAGKGKGRGATVGKPSVEMGPPTGRSDDWTCTACRCINESSRSACVMRSCGAARS